MEGLLWVLGYALLFYFMMRFGCGSHMVHGHGGHGGHGGQQGEEGSHAGHGSARRSGDATDPVCGMQVSPGDGYSRSYQGREFRFCSRNCLDQFDSNPARFAGQPRS